MKIILMIVPALQQALEATSQEKQIVKTRQSGLEKQIRNAGINVYANDINLSSGKFSDARKHP